jgi:hypothetical protein
VILDPDFRRQNGFSVTGSETLGGVDQVRELLIRDLF